MLSDRLKNPKICDNYLVVETKMYFLAEPMESGTYLDDHILLYCVYRHEFHMVVIVNSTMVGDALECFRTAFPLEM